MKRKLLLVLTVAAALCAAGFYYLSAPRHSNVMLIVLDTLRADHLGLYGYERPTSPVLDSFGAENLVFDYAVAAAPWTPPAVGSMMTGLYPSAHGMMPPNSRNLAKRESAKLGAANVTLAEIFREHGFTTAAVTPNPWITPTFGFDQGFDKFIFRERAPAGRITQLATGLLDFVTERGKPFFLFVHYLDPHDPYDPPAEYRNLFPEPLESRQYEERIAKKIDLYDGEIRYLDSELGKLFDELKRRGLWEDLKIVVVADHGEQFMERGHVGHGFQLYDEEVWIPLIVKGAGRSGREKRTVSNMDVFPTLLEMAGVSKPAVVHGVSLLGQGGEGRPGVLSEIRRIYDLRSIASPEGKKLILDFDAEKLQAEGGEVPRVVGTFDRVQDPFELTPLGDEAVTRELRAEFDAALQRALEHTVESETVQFKDEVLEQLKSLGYLK